MTLLLLYIFRVLCTSFLSSSLEAHCKSFCARVLNNLAYKPPCLIKIISRSQQQIGVSLDVQVLTCTELDIPRASRRTKTRPILLQALSRQISPHKSRPALRTVEIANFITGLRLRRATIVIYEPFN